MVNDLPQSIQGSIIQPDEYSNSSRLHLASCGGPPPDILLQPGTFLREIIIQSTYKGKKVSKEIVRYNIPT